MHTLALAFAFVVVVSRGAAHAAPARLDVTTAKVSQAWQQGRASPFVATITGVGRRTVRITCADGHANYLSAMAARDGVPAPVVWAGLSLVVVPPAGNIRCEAYDGLTSVARWSGTLASPAITLPDQRITKLAATRCGDSWCADVTLDRSHPAATDASLDVLCTLSTARKEPWIATLAPAPRGMARTVDDQVVVTIPDAPGATQIRCVIGDDRFKGQFVDADFSNNHATTTVANTAPPVARLAITGVARAHLTLYPGTCEETCGSDTLSAAVRIHNRGPALAGLGVRCQATTKGVTLELLGRSGAIASGATAVVIASIGSKASDAWRVAGTFVGPITTRCETVVWDQPALKPSRWSGTVRFPAK